MKKILLLLNLSLLVMPLLLATELYAKEAEPTAEDPALEKRVNEIASELRCLVCQNQTIADSHAELAVDLKNQVREMVREGQDQEQIVAYMVQRYGDFVLYRPPVKNTTILLWVGPFLLLVIGLVVLVVSLRKRNKLVRDDAPLSAEEQQRLQAMLAADKSAAENKNEVGENKS